MAVRAHWEIENQLYWMIDAIFRSDSITSQFSFWRAEQECNIKKNW